MKRQARETTLEGIAIVSLTTSVSMAGSGQVIPSLVLAALGLAVLYLKYTVREKR